MPIAGPLRAPVVGFSVTAGDPWNSALEKEWQDLVVRHERLSKARQEQYDNALTELEVLIAPGMETEPAENLIKQATRVRELLKPFDPTARTV